jgi:hypothetical protein
MIFYHHGLFLYIDNDYFGYYHDVKILQDLSIYRV